MEMGANEKLHHYTSIEVLALILKNRTIRFNRLDMVDDLEECNTVSNGINLSKYTFVSCWTKSEEENIPLWKLYANGHDGVRISFPKDFFEEYEITSGDVIKLGFDPIGSVGKYILPPSEIFATTHMFVPPIKTGVFYRPIKYVDDIKMKADNIVKIDADGSSIETGEIGSYKNKRWAFQDEFRFVLTAFPKPANIDISNPNFAAYLNSGIRSNAELHFQEYFLKIKEPAFDKMEVVLCPSASESQYLIVDALLKAYAPNAQLRNSNLKDKVNLK